MLFLVFHTRLHRCLPLARQVALFLSMFLWPRSAAALACHLLLRHFFFFTLAYFCRARKCLIVSLRALRFGEGESIFPFNREFFSFSSPGILSGVFISLCLFHVSSFFVLLKLCASISTDTHESSTELIDSSYSLEGPENS